LRQFLYLGLNEDEQERMVFDGLLVHIAGGKRGGDFNQRFGQPSASLQPNMSNLFPFSDTVQTDPVTGRTNGLLEQLVARRQMPKIFFTNTSTEYWRGDASLIHTNVEGTKDVAPSASVRIYHLAGTQHSSGTLPLTDTNPVDGARGQQKFNSVDYTTAAGCAGANGSVGNRARGPTAESVSVPSRRHGGTPGAAKASIHGTSRGGFSGLSTAGPAARPWPDAERGVVRNYPLRSESLTRTLSRSRPGRQ
jgi:Alpha/beta hydrolase domain